ncbi:MAG: sugar ABC transporter ATP-binding protein, partial [Hyphomicrobiales bacterium]
MTSERLLLSNVGKSFGAIRALDGVTMSVPRGTVHGLLGENGAGKSTLLRILSGIFDPSEGHVEIDGVKVAGRGPVGARQAGIAMIHQELQHVAELTVAQNMFLGRPLKKAGGLLVDWAAQERAAAEALRSLDPGIDPSVPIRTLKVAQRQIVEIARAVMEDAKVIAMDEPTSSLTPAEFDRLAVLIRQLAARGVTVIYVSHKMDEVFTVCQTATILRDGRKVDDVVLAETTEAGVISRMVGRELAQAEHKGFATSDVILDVRNLSRGAAVQDASFRLHRGE